MAQTEKTIYVYENWRSDVPTLIGKLFRQGAGELLFRI